MLKALAFHKALLEQSPRDSLKLEDDLFRSQHKANATFKPMQKIESFGSLGGEWTRKFNAILRPERPLKPSPTLLNYPYPCPLLHVSVTAGCNPQDIDIRVETKSNDTHAPTTMADATAAVGELGPVPFSVPVYVATCMTYCKLMYETYPGVCKQAVGQVCSAPHRDNLAALLLPFSRLPGLHMHIGNHTNSPPAPRPFPISFSRARCALPRFSKSGAPSNSSRCPSTATTQARSSSVRG